MSRVRRNTVTSTIFGDFVCKHKYSPIFYGRLCFFAFEQLFREDAVIFLFGALEDWPTVYIFQQLVRALIQSSCGCFPVLPLIVIGKHRESGLLVEERLHDSTKPVIERHHKGALSTVGQDLCDTLKQLFSVGRVIDLLWHHYDKRVRRGKSVEINIH